jgi:moderate conductance mechanosensitive channel
VDDTPVVGNVSTWLDGVPLGEILEIALVILLALIAHVVVSRVIKTLVRRAIERAPARQRSNRSRNSNIDEGVFAQLQERTRQRAQAIGTLTRSASVLVIWTTAIITILAIIGINVTPILASAGVVGVVIGFGAQQLVGDYLAGISMIVEDQLGVGDIVNVGDVTGTVEEVALRYTRIRDFSGTVWYIRNGQMNFVANQSQGWTNAIVDIPIATDSDLTLVRDTVTTAGEAMLADKAFADDLLGAPSFGGIEAITGDAVTVRIVAKIRPEHQFAVTRALREQMRDALTGAGIKIPLPRFRIQEGP